MKYFNEEHIRRSSPNWEERVKVIEDAVQYINQGEYAQPVKPYLRYRDRTNRIIAMPAFIGGDFNMAGIKWIASFPGNLQIGLPRAHSVVILNDADTGLPQAIINTATLSAIRTASVSGVLVKRFCELKDYSSYNIGIIGFGPIGRHHLEMCKALLGEKIGKICLYDIKGIDQAFIPIGIGGEVVIVESWADAFADADIFITCTVSQAPYIDIKPKDGSLHLNVSLRDYKVDTFQWFEKAIVVDDWEEACRESTDIERFHQQKGLVKEGTQSIIDIVCNDGLSVYEKDQPVMFNPMGMAVFDIAMATYFLSSLGEVAIELD